MCSALKLKPCSICNPYPISKAQLSNICCQLCSNKWSMAKETCKPTCKLVCKRMQAARSNQPNLCKTHTTSSRRGSPYRASSRSMSLSNNNTSTHSRLTCRPKVMRTLNYNSSPCRLGSIRPCGSLRSSNCNRPCCSNCSCPCCSNRNRPCKCKQCSNSNITINDYNNKIITTYSSSSNIVSRVNFFRARHEHNAFAHMQCAALPYSLYSNPCSMRLKTREGAHSKP
mmetsp:Transcript_16273/g.27918  ORF Transcript_16273/g.27918 Transcript_16273/m.27918 type:complete len:227 (+) Transcript_16273:569-1249(+)